VIEVSIPVTAPAPPVDFLITLESLTANVAPPWPSPEPRGDRPPERVSMDLPDPVDTWTLEVDCHIPSMGVDKGLGDRFGFVPLFTLHGIDGSLLEVRAEPLYARVMLVHIAADGTEMELIRQYDARLARLDTLRIEVAAMPGGIGMSAVSGGHRREPVRTPGRPFFDLSAIDSITFGDAQGQLKVPLDLLRVSLWPGQADINVGIEWESGDLSCDADLDQDGWVTGADILVLLMWWGDCPERDGKDEVDCLADLNEDGLVDIHDLLLLLVDLGPCDDTHVP